MVHKFNVTAFSQHRVTDKVRDHAYETMYGTLLLPFLSSTRQLLTDAAAPPRPLKMLEIGLGCDAAAAATQPA